MNIFLESAHGLYHRFQDTFTEAHLRSHEKCRNQVIRMGYSDVFNIKNYLIRNKILYPESLIFEN